MAARARLHSFIAHRSKVEQQRQMDLSRRRRRRRCGGCVPLRYC